jgi:hypothetical protein
MCVEILLLTDCHVDPWKQAKCQKIQFSIKREKIRISIANYLWEINPFWLPHFMWQTRKAVSELYCKNHFHLAYDKENKEIECHQNSALFWFQTIFPFAIAWQKTIC